MLYVVYQRGNLVWRQIMDIDEFLPIFDNENYNILEVVVMAD